MRNAASRTWSSVIMEQKVQRIFVVLGILFAVILTRLFYLQIIRYTHYRDLSDSNSLRLIPQRAPRGLITDRKGVILASNVPTYSLFLVPADMKTYAGTLLRLSRILSVPIQDLEKLVSDRQKSRRFEPVRLLTHLEPDLIARIEENRARLPGAYVQMEPERYYPHGESAAHLLGYIGEISEGELFQLRDVGYRPGDVIGKRGVEKIYDSILGGQTGGVQVEVNAAGVQKRTLAYVPPVQGHTLVLTIDHHLQRLAEELMGEQAGAIVAVDPRTGGILAMASRPGFDPNQFVGGISHKDWNRLIRDDRHPLQNRAIQGRYPPGSIFKIVTTVSALDDEEYDREKTRLCRGIFWYKTWPYRCWSTSGHGWVNLRRAIVESCDIYFYQLGLSVKIDKLYKACRRFGLGSRTRVDLDSEDSGLVPNPRWKESTQNMPWFPGNTIQMSIGQGYLLTTPLQMLDVTSAVAMRNRVFRPHVLQRVLDQKTRRPRRESRPEILLDAGVPEKDMLFLRDSLEQVISWGSGTGKRSRIPGVRVAGKTGTSENPHGENHAWFTAFAPVEAPEVAVIVLVENGGEGGLVAAPIAKRIIEAALGMNVTPMATPTPAVEEEAVAPWEPTPSPIADLTPVAEEGEP